MALYSREWDLKGFKVSSQRRYGGLGVVFLCVCFTPLSTIFQLYCDGLPVNVI
jgi:hypothetical protein